MCKYSQLELFGVICFLKPCSHLRAAPHEVSRGGTFVMVWMCFVRRGNCLVLSALPCLACGTNASLQKLVLLKVRPHLHANTNEAGWGEAYANICLDCNTRQNVVIRRASEWFSLKYRLQADSVRSASDRTEAVFLALVTHLRCYACLALACLARIFVVMWMRLKGVFMLEQW